MTCFNIHQGNSLFCIRGTTFEASVWSDEVTKVRVLYRGKDESFSVRPRCFQTLFIPNEPLRIETAKES